MTTVDLTRPETRQSAIGNADAGAETGPNASLPAAARARVGPWLAESFPKPEIWHDAPGLRATWLYAHHGEQHPHGESALRLLSRAYAAFALLPQGGLLIAAWLVQRPSRLVAFFALWELLAHTRLGFFLPHV